MSRWLVGSVPSWLLLLGLIVVIAGGAARDLVVFEKPDGDRLRQSLLDDVRGHRGVAGHGGRRLIRRGR